MKKFFSPFFIVSILTIIGCLYVLINDNHGWGLLLSFYLFPAAVVVLIIDVGLKTFIKSLKKVFLIELLLIGILVIAYQYGERTKHLIIENDFNQEYVSIVYGVENEKPLNISLFTWHANIDIPQNGILMTSSDFDTDLPRTQMKFQSGESLGGEEKDKHLVYIGDYEFESLGKVYFFRSWKIQEGFCCGYSSNEVKEQVEKLRLELTKKASR